MNILDELEDFILLRRRRALVREMALLIDTGLGGWARMRNVMKEIGVIDRLRMPRPVPEERHPSYACQMRRQKIMDAIELVGGFVGRMLLVLAGVIALNWAATLWP